MGMNDLKLIDVVQRTSPSTEDKRRLKLISKIDRYLSLLTCDPVKLPTRNRWIFLQPDGSFQLAIMYGSKSLEISKGKHGIACANVEQLATALRLVRESVVAGKLDAQIEAAAGAIREGFKR